MEEKVTECLKKISEAIKTLIVQANNEAELIGLVTLLTAGFQGIFDDTVDKAYEELQVKLKEGR